MNHWKIRDLDLKPSSPRILSSTDDARAIIIELPRGEALADHEVHERAWVTVVEGEVAITTTAGGEQVIGGPGMLVEFDPSERHRVDAHTDARLLLLLTPWPGSGHPGAMRVEDKARVRESAAAKNPA